MPEFADTPCAPCRGGEPPMGAAEVARFLREIRGWEAVDDHHLAKRYRCQDFREALALVNRFGGEAEDMGHHPVLEFSWGWVEARIWTHKIDGLNIADFVLAARFDRAAAHASSAKSSGRGEGT